MAFYRAVSGVPSSGARNLAPPGVFFLGVSVECAKKGDLAGRLFIWVLTDGCDISE
jgi:hypothetical protein